MKRPSIFILGAICLAACASQTPAAVTLAAPRALRSATATAAAAAVSTSVSQSLSPTPLAVTPAAGTPVEVASTAQAAAPSATAAADNPLLKVTSSRGYLAQQGYYIIGEVENLGAAPMSAVQVSAIYEYKFSGKPIMDLGSEQTTTALSVIPAKGKSPFILGPYTFPEPVTMYELKVQGQEGRLPRQDLVVQSSNDYSVGSWLYLRGEVRNTGTTNAQYVKAVFTLYDQYNHVIGVVQAYASPDSIPAGGFSTFAAATDYWPGFDHYALQVQGQ
jgi:hypothetical protein